MILLIGITAKYSIYVMPQQKLDSAQHADVSEANVYILLYSTTIFHNKLTNTV